MNLRERLERLRHQAGAADPAPAPSPLAAALPAAPSLRERLARLSAARAPAGTRGLDALIRLTGGIPAGPDLFMMESRWPMPWRHGGTSIAFAAGEPVVLPIRKGQAVAVPPERLLFLDTETTGLSGGSGTFAFLLGLATVEGPEFVVRQYLATRFSGEPAMLDILRSALDRTACIVSYNGKSFDVPLLRTRYGLHRQPQPFGERSHCDLLHATRRQLKRDWPDCRLKTAEARAAGFHRLDDMPGAEVPAAWQRWLVLGDASAVPRILDHNRDDLISLAALLAVLGAAAMPLFGEAASECAGTGFAFPDSSA